MIEFKEVSKTFEDGFEALKDISFKVKEGELLVLIGPSGCGKTTTMKMVNRLIEPTKGTITIEGKDIAGEDPVTLRRNTGYVIQQIGLLPHMNIKENVSLVPRLKKWKKEQYVDKVNELMEMVGLDPETFGERYPSELSGGQQQRVGVIRALAAEPKIILMDEPFSALDPISREQLQDELVRLQREIRKTIVFVTHDMDEALKIADRICIMKDGEIVQLDRPENILRHPSNEFVRNFIGEDRLQENVVMPKLKKLMVTPVTAYNMRGLAESLKLMRRKRVDSLVVVDNDDTFLGIATVWDVQKNYKQEDLTLNDIMETDIATLQLDDPAEEAFQLVNDSRFGFVPVVDEQNRLHGIVNRASLVEHIVDQIVN
ncbi:ABC transporter ATP-binding protein [Paenactinomyces guangxiensis]|uniref:Quaternary amine transport ATP-binding protein n=1 Tax=Paenactinomyces guangxiensis TaxID=1490290 RepID=A0A7W1WPS0_9BACL|nr:betaine/proline/choline family ABC transporter ATP-binding protein [Paenactinomyces guangxiensis]MBA4493827.1 betaine/proline/choline family ABC transporter ATP-binding protein [Paenactinomyces guangxiensis]MBH8591293.1 betaine/proline/choline family ABC transporter ATP-binding protein [Paenactinomyces guangxiensis]